jgi:hypothetical protein
MSNKFVTVIIHHRHKPSDLDYYSRQINDAKMNGTCSMHGEMKNAYQILVGKH